MTQLDKLQEKPLNRLRPGQIGARLGVFIQLYFHQRSGSLAKTVAEHIKALLVHPDFDVPLLSSVVLFGVSRRTGVASRGSVIGLPWQPSRRKRLVRRRYNDDGDRIEWFVARRCKLAPVGIGAF